VPLCPAGGTDGDQYWTALVTEVDDMIWQAVHAGFAYFQREAGYTRTGSHNTRVNGRETGQRHEADLAVAHWLQHTSRDGDMQLHVHSQIAHTAKTGTDGKWRAPDSLGYNEQIGAVGVRDPQKLSRCVPLGANERDVHTVVVTVRSHLIAQFLYSIGHRLLNGSVGDDCSGQRNRRGSRSGGVPSLPAVPA